MIYNQDCLEAMKDIPDYSIDAIITDPPYGTTACKWDSVIDFKLMWEQLNRIIKPNGATVLFGSEPFSSALRMSNIKNYKYDWIWIKNRPTGTMLAKRQPMRNVENILVFYKSQPKYNRQMIKRTPEEFKKYYRKNNSESKNGEQMRYRKNPLIRQSKDRQWYKPPIQTLYYNSDSKRNGKSHPTQKPVALMEYLIKTYTNENETVLDFTMGSGTTGVACLNTNRKFIGIENNKEYFEAAVKRIQQHKAQKRLF
jgi:site-specific DNA-methyltransferase (adenine-specific)